MRNPAALALARPQVVGLLTLLFVCFGWLSYLGLPRQENPTLRNRHADVRVYLPGAEPAKVERLVTKVLEAQLSEVDDIEDVFSVSARGQASLIIELQRGAPLEQRLQEIRAKVQAARVMLPAEASDPEIDTEVLRTNTMILALAMERTPAGSGDAAALEMRALALELERELRRLPDVRRVGLLGLPHEEIEVGVDPGALSGRGLEMRGLIDALQRRNVALPSGELELGGARSSVETNALWSASDQVGTTLLRAVGDGHAVRVSDVASIRRQLAHRDVRVSHDGAPAVSIAIEMLDGRNAVVFGDRIREWIAEREGTLPFGFRIGVVADEPTYVRDRLQRLFGSLRIGMLLVAGVTLAGMGWRSGSVVSLSIPLSLVVAFGFMGIAGVALQQLSIAAMVIGIGLVVDEAIVVADSFQRHVDLGESPRQAAIDGLGEIHMAILAGAATTVAAFIPLFLMEGDIGDFIRSIPLVVSLMLLGSVVVAHFVTPLLCVLVHERCPRRAASNAAGLRSRSARAAHDFYRRALDASLAHPVWLLTGFAAALVSSFVAVGVFLWPPEFFGAADRHQLLVQVRLAAVAPVEQTAEVVAEIGAWLDEQPDVQGWTGYAGSEAPKFYYNEFPIGRAESAGMLVVNTRESLPFHHTKDLAKTLNAHFADRVPGAWVRARELRQGYGRDSDIQVYLQGDDLEVLRGLTRDIAKLARSEPGVVDVHDSFGYESVTLATKVDETRARALGIDHEDVAVALRTALDGIRVTSLPERDVEIPVVVRLREDLRRDTGDLTTLPIYSPVAGRSVPLGQLAHLEPGFSAGSILRFDRQREGSISIEVDGVPIPTATDRIEARVAQEVNLPPGVTLYYYGLRKEANESFLSLARAAVVAIFLIYTILVIRFQSLGQPALVVLAIPMALIGSIWGLVLTGMSIGFTAFLGMIALTGIVVNDAIVLLDYTNTLRDRGRVLRDAIIEGAQTRVRPVLMTSLTTIAGLLPLALQGGDFWGPFGYAMIFGLAASTLLTLLILPASYWLLEGRRHRRFAWALPGRRRLAPAE